MQTDWHALEFTKTRGWEARDRHDDELSDYAGLLDWCRRRGLIERTVAEQLAREASARPQAARAAVRRARDLRELSYRVLSALGTGEPPDSDTLREVAAWVHRHASARHLDTTAAGITWRWQFDTSHLDQVLAPIAWSLGDLLVAPEATRVHLCEGDDCGWLFIDASRAGSRRWCSMEECGNLMKARRHRQRERAT